MNTQKGIGPNQLTTYRYPKGKKIVFGIGINAYDSKSWPRLNNAVRDVTQVRDLLINQYDFDDALLLCDDQATSAAIEDELYRFTDPRVLGENDSLLIYYSGHGHLDKNERGYWVPIDAKHDKISTYIPNSRIRELISDIKCRHVLLISDACFSGSLFVRGIRSAGSDAVAEEYEKRVSRWAFCSGRHDEVVSDGPPGKHSPFATAILQELGLNTTRKLNIARLADKVIEITRSNYRQMPEANPIIDAGHMGGQFVFTPKNLAQWDQGREIKPPPIEEEQPNHRQIPQKTIVLLLMICAVISLILAFALGLFSPKKPEITQVWPTPKSIALDTIEIGQVQKIEFKLKNIGNAEARLKSVQAFGAAEISIAGNEAFVLPCDSIKTFFAYWTPDSLGAQKFLLIVPGENLKKQETVTVTAFVREKTKAPVEPPTRPESTASANPGRQNTNPTHEVINPGVQPNGNKTPVQKPVDEKPMTKTVQTDIPPDVKMWLITDDGTRIDAKNGTFEIPILLSGKSVKVYFERAGNRKWDRFRIGQDEIVLPNGL